MSTIIKMANNQALWVLVIAVVVLALWFCMSNSSESWCSYTPTWTNCPNGVPEEGMTQSDICEKCKKACKKYKGITHQECITGCGRYCDHGPRTRTERLDRIPTGGYGKGKCPSGQTYRPATCICPRGYIKLPNDQCTREWNY